MGDAEKVRDDQAVGIVHEAEPDAGGNGVDDRALELSELRGRERRERNHDLGDCEHLVGRHPSIGGPACEA